MFPSRILITLMLASPASLGMKPTSTSTRTLILGHVRRRRPSTPHLPFQTRAKMGSPRCPRTAASLRRRFAIDSGITLCCRRLLRMMLFWYMEHKFDSGPSLELYMLDRSIRVAVTDPDEECVPSLKRNYIWETPPYRYEPPKSWIHCLRTKMAFSSLKVEMPRMITLSKIKLALSKVKLALVLSFCIVTTALWWHSFVTLVAHPTSSQPFLSPIAVLDLLAYFVTLREEIPLHIYYYLRWPVLAASVVQALASAAALWFYYHLSFFAPQYTVSPAFDLSPYTPRCDVRALLYDPTLGSYFATYGALPTIVAYAVFIIAFAIAAYQRFKPKNIVLALMTGNALAATFDLVMLLIMALRPRHPVAWDPVCGLVHVMMSNRRGYVDVPGTNKWQTVKMFFTVIS
ncbi:hypothetical protein B0H14DRAFT_3722175 [Mycena olivaceomarginata]|nr:hypothetical protein B0H14DRAFT_3722175 [Mycena olivaceomarginata]